MLRSLGNLLIILLICITAVGVSINTSPIIDKAKSVMAHEKEEVIVSLVCDVEAKFLKNPKTITIRHQATGETTLNFYDDNLLKAIIYKNNKVFKTYDFEKLPDASPYTLQLTKDMPHSVNIDISQERLELPNGKYEIVISSNAMELKYSTSPISLDVEYLSNAPYIPASSEIPEGKMALTLYFPDSNNSLSQLIGVTRFVNTSNNPHNTAIKELQKGPAGDIGLSLYPPIGNVDYAVIKDSTLYINLPSDEQIYNSDRSSIALNSFIKSLSTLPRVNRIRFLVDNKRAKTFFNGADIDKFIKESWENKAYLAFNSFKRYYLVDCDVENIDEKDLPTEKVGKILKALKNSDYLYLSNTIPEDVEVINYYIDKNTLNLNFNNVFLKSFENNINLQRMMLDSILFSFTSIEGIDYVQILVEGNIIKNFAGVDVSNPLPKPLFINPESVS